MFDRSWPDEIIPLLNRTGPVEPEQRELIARCVEFIDREIPGPEPLWQACPRCDDCWRTERGREPRPMSARIPYIGPDYLSHRVAVVAINSRDNGRAGDEVRTTAHVIDWLKRGHREYGSHSFFHYRVACAVHVAIRSLEGEAVDEMPAPDVAADSLAASARLQAVQCSPESSSRRTPTPAMTRNCPEFLLRGQLEIIAPRVLLLFGRPAHQVIEKAKLQMRWDAKWADNDRCFSRGQGDFQGQEMTVFASHHPAHTGWNRSWRHYLESVRTQPLGDS